MPNENITYSYTQQATDLLNLLNAMVRYSHKDILSVGSGYDDGTSVTIRQPGVDESFYYFYTDAEGVLQHKTLSMQALSTFGSICDPELLPNSKSNTAVTALLHSNRKDYWVITKPFFGNEFKAYLVTENEISSSPVITTIGNNVSPIEESRMLVRSSLIGGRLGYKLNTSDSYETYKIDETTGVILSNIRFVGLGGNAFAFSKSGQKLYVSRAEVDLSESILEMNFRNGTSTGMYNAAIVVASVTDNPITELRYADDNRLFVTTTDNNYFGVLNKGVYTEGVYSRLIVQDNCNCDRTGINTNSHLTGKDAFYLSEYAAYNTVFFNTSLTTLPSNSNVLMTLEKNTEFELILSFTQIESNFSLGITMSTDGVDSVDFSRIKGFTNIQLSEVLITELGLKKEFELDVITENDELIHLNGISTLIIGTAVPNSCRLLDELEFRLLDELGNIIAMETCDYVLPEDSIYILEEYNYRILTENGERILIY